MKRVACVLLSLVVLNTNSVGHEAELARRFSGLVGVLAGRSMGLREEYNFNSKTIF